MKRKITMLEEATKSIIMVEEAFLKLKNQNGSTNQKEPTVSTGEREALRPRFKKSLSVVTLLFSKLLMSYRWLIKLELGLQLSFLSNR
jgi:hypothetical protein